VNEFDIGNVWQWVLLANAIGTFGLSLLVMYLGTKFTKRSEHAALSAEVKGLANKIDAVEDRLTKGDMQFQFLEKAIAALPTREQLAEIKLAIEQVAGHARVVEEQGKAAREMFRILENRMTMIDTFLREITKSEPAK